MRALTLVFILATASAAQAQPVAGLERDRDARLAADQLAQRRREVALQNELAAEAPRARADAAVSDLAAANARPVMPQVRYDPKALPRDLDISQFAQIPDAALAASNARAVAASRNKK